MTIEGRACDIFVFIPLPHRIHEREMDKTDILGTFNAGATLGPVNETNMARIWNKHKQTNTPLKRKVFVGLSGGVDSAVSAALLKETGHEVVGVFIKAWQAPFLSCTSAEDRESAMRVAAHLDIPFLTLDAGEEYRARVVEYLVKEYRAGRTPNPDVMCNKMIKFGVFYRFAREAGADAVATGHYARVEEAGGGHALLKGRDPLKDQSYFLWTLTEDILAHTLFPVGDFHKKEVRTLAQKFGLPNAERKDSQGICFLGKVSMREFLAHFIPEVAGDVLDEGGRVIGTHTGAAFLTIGQRGGFKVFHESPLDPPLYVVEKNMKENTVTVAPRPQAAAHSRSSITLEDVHWISHTPPPNGTIMSVRTRYRGPLAHATIAYEGKKSTLLFLEKPEPFASGQSAVCYDREVCLGGGVISD